ncbi:MAG: hypothetical protein ACYC99_14565 [Candidatus Geothermincolia bacterium]
MHRKRTAVNRKYTLVLLLAIFMVAGSIIAGCGAPAEKPQSISQIKITESEMPGWTLKEVEATRDNADKKSIVAQLYDEGAVDILNQIFEQAGRKLQVNYVQMKDTAGGRWAESMLESAVGGTNYIGSKGNIAIEIIGTPQDTGLAAGALNLTL